ncbi:MAG TPA: NADP-dependent oxidoreductase [Marmoricola sp.]|jgi:NADPH:quinone reductase-like Zn-dependent oxidoreductase|nr:NADP-dependent oxidoreductase [Marmoricola sp.]
MKAIAVEAFSEAPRLMDLPDPEPGPGEILVALEAAAINPIDWKAADGAFQTIMDITFPLILGFDGAGRVEAVGAQATRFTVGDRVHGQFWGDALGPGTYAEHIAISEHPSHGALERTPEDLAPSLAAALPTSGMTAEGALAATRCGAGQTLLVLGAPGGVGVLATQLAARGGVRVIATARAEEAAWIVGFGAEETIDHSAAPVVATVADTHPDGIDAILDLVGSHELVTAAADLVRDGGAIVSTAFGVTDELARQGRLSATNYQLDDRPARLERVTEAVATGDLVVPVQEVVPLAAGVDAIARLRRGGARGKTIIEIEADRTGGVE